MKLGNILNNSDEKWNPQKIQCRQCNDIIYSKYPGEWVQCKCGAIYVDQTKYYERYGGKVENFIYLDDNSI